MALFEEILNLPINLIKNYILQNKFYKSYNQDPATMPASTRYTANLFWMLGRNIKLTAKKVNLAEEFLNLLEEIVKPINLQQLEEKNSLNLESTTHALELPLKELQKKINLELQTVLRERLFQQIEPGAYDASLEVFLKLISFMLERIHPLSHAVFLEYKKPESHITKTLIFLEKTLFTIKFYCFLQEHGAYLTMQLYISKDHIEFLAKKLSDVISILHKVKIEKASLSEEEILIYQRILMQNVISGLMFNFQSKNSPAVRSIIAELDLLKQAIEREQDEHEQKAQHEQLHAPIPMVT
jgi:hypothetical protein